ncbi:hypothetical protein [uncultured Traorella sp.]|uniref:hypothetical protein n=1 Tax=uncultured Traorella sp. TaxID=1929048 RepID=UPI0025E1B6A1|nr:hypothetical protein [uncultured Traorella sp.]
MSGIKAVHRFLSRLIFGSGLAIWLGMKADDLLNTSPLLLILFLLYVVLGSLYLLVKELPCGK